MVDQMIAAALTAALIGGAVVQPRAEPAVWKPTVGEVVRVEPARVKANVATERALRRWAQTFAHYEREVSDLNPSVSSSLHEARPSEEGAVERSASEREIPLSDIIAARERERYR
jgi:hypothetical protein